MTDFAAVPENCHSLTVKVYDFDTDAELTTFTAELAPRGKLATESLCHPRARLLANSPAHPLRGKCAAATWAPPRPRIRVWGLPLGGRQGITL